MRRFVASPMSSPQIESRRRRIMLVAGEASGDRHAAELFRHLRRLMPNIQGFGMGGPKMAAAGIDVRYDSSAIAVVGLVEVFKHYLEIRRALHLMCTLACSEKPDLLILVDYKEFNYRLAAKAKACGIQVLFYVSPQIWAWRPGRAAKYGRVIDMMAVIFPFEVPLYEAHEVPVRYVGHPLAGQVRAAKSPAEVRASLGLKADSRIIGLLPGSRGHEIRRLLPPMLGAAERLAVRFPDAEFVLPLSPGLPDESIAPCLGGSRVKVHVTQLGLQDVVSCANAVVTSSGTATLEVSLLGVPMVIVYRMSLLTYWVARLVVITKYMGLPNIIAGRRIVPELVQGDVNPQRIETEIARFLEDSAYTRTVQEGLAEVVCKLGPGGGSENMARLALEMLESGNADQR